MLIIESLHIKIALQVREQNIATFCSFLQKGVIQWEGKEKKMEFRITNILTNFSYKIR